MAEFQYVSKDDSISGNLSNMEAQEIFLEPC